jgi:hypothetical protein
MLLNHLISILYQNVINFKILKIEPTVPQNEKYNPLIAMLSGDLSFLGKHLGKQIKKIRETCKPMRMM